jgi:hypothetical protein
MILIWSCLIEEEEGLQWMYRFDEKWKKLLKMETW